MKATHVDKRNAESSQVREVAYVGRKTARAVPVVQNVVDERERAIQGREAAIEAITQKARAERPRHSRTFWIAALVVGMLGVGAFFEIIRTEGEMPASSTRAPHESGFATGAVIGLALGIAIGFAVGRRRER